MRSRISSFLQCMSACAALACFSSQVQAQTQTVLTFDELQDGEPLAAYYNGGLGGLGTGPGPNLGVLIDASVVHLDAAVGGTGEFGSAPSPSGALLVTSITTINAEQGFSDGLSFFYANPTSTTEVRIFDGPDQSGHLLSIAYLAASPRGADGRNPFVPASLVFTGTAHSIGLASRGPGGLYLDNLTLGRSTPGSAKPTSYTLLDLGPVTDRADASAAPIVNRAGQMIVQTRLADRRSHVVLFWDPVTASSTELGSFGVADTTGTGLNSLGQVVGSSRLEDGYARAFLWDATTGLVNLGTLGGVESMALGINDSGQVVGMSSLATLTADGCLTHAFLWDNGVMTDLNDLAIANRDDWQVLERATSISDNGVIVGSGQAVGTSKPMKRYFALVPTKK